MAGMHVTVIMFTVESRFYELPRENENWFEKSKTSTGEGKRILVRVIRRFAKLRVQEIGIPLYL